MNDDMLILVDQPVEEGKTVGHRPRRPGLRVLIVAVLAGAGLLWWWAADADTSPGERTASALDAPEEPLEDAGPPAIATGWRGARLPGQGTVAALAHGPAGWVAVVEGGELPAVFTSPDGVLWSYASYPGPGPTDPVATVAGIGFLVAGIPADDPASSTLAVSRDGEDWTTVHLDGLAVRGVDAAAGRAFLYGDAAGGPAVVMVGEDGASTPLTLPGAVHVAGVVDAGGVPTAIGLTETGWARWTLGNTEPAPEPVEVPDGVAAPLEVFVGRDGVWRATTGDPGGAVERVVASGDLDTWKPEGAPLPDGTRGVVAGPERLLAWGEATSLVLERTWDGWRETAIPSGVPTGVEDLASVGAVAASEHAVAVGGLSTTGKPAIWMHGTSQPVALLPGPGLGEAWWRVEAGADAVAGSRLTTAARRGGEVFIGSSAYVWLGGRDDGGARHVAPTLLSGGDRVTQVGDEVFAIGPSGPEGTAVYRYRDDAVWEREIVPLDDVEAIALAGGGRILALGPAGSAAPQVAERIGDGEWEPAGATGAPDVEDVTAVPGGFIGRDGQGGVFSQDGLVWTADPRFSAPGGPGFAVSGETGDSTTVLVADVHWGEAMEVEVPARSVRRLLVDTEGGIWAEAPGEVLVRRPGEEWTHVPASVDQGVTGSSWILLPPEPGAAGPGIAMIDGRRLQILEWS